MDGHSRTFLTHFPLPQNIWNTFRRHFEQESGRKAAKVQNVVERPWVLPAAVRQHFGRFSPVCCTRSPLITEK
eukprot:8206203-Prorocentrum_lima.AAC.1